MEIYDQWGFKRSLIDYTRHGYPADVFHFEQNPTEFFFNYLDLRYINIKEYQGESVLSVALPYYAEILPILRRITNHILDIVSEHILNQSICENAFCLTREGHKLLEADYHLQTKLQLVTSQYTDLRRFDTEEGQKEFVAHLSADKLFDNIKSIVKLAAEALNEDYLIAPRYRNFGA